MGSGHAGGPGAEPTTVVPSFSNTFEVGHQLSVACPYLGHCARYGIPCTVWTRLLGGRGNHGGASGYQCWVKDARDVTIYYRLRR